MPSRTARKRLHYVRAVYNTGTHPQKTFQGLVAQALGALKTAPATQVPLASVGVWMVRHRQVTGDRIMLAIGGGEPNEPMSTLGLAPKTAKVDDDEEAVKPPATRAFKLYDAHCLIAGDDILVCLDHASLAALRRYLSELLALAGLPAAATAFELVPVANKSKQEILDAEGVKAIHVRSALYAATVDGTGAGSLWSNLKNGLRDVFATALPEAKLRDALAERLGEVNVELVIQAKGGTRAEELVLEGMDAVGREILEEIDDAGSRVSVVTQHDTRIKANEIVLGKVVGMHRNGNALDQGEAWDALAQYERELRDTDYWQS